MENGNNAIVDQSSRLCTENLKNDDNLTSKTKSKRYSCSLISISLRQALLSFFRGTT